MSFNTSSYINEVNEFYPLPTPNWVKTSSNFSVAILTGQNAITDTYAAKIPRLPEGLNDLMADGRVKYQFGRISARDYTNRPVGRARGRKIKWFAPNCDIAGCNALHNADIGGENLIISNRANVLDVFKHNQISNNLEFWTFYKLKPCRIFNGNPATNGSDIIVDVPYFTGNPTYDARAINYDDFLPGGSRYGKRPARPVWRQRFMSTSYWYCRLLVLDDNPNPSDRKVMYYGPVSEALVVKPNELPFDEHNMVGLTSYSFNKFYTTIEDKYRM